VTTGRTDAAVHTCHHDLHRRPRTGG
jgi:hypothetical protein